MAQEKPRASRAKTAKATITEETGAEKPATARSRKAAAPTGDAAKPVPAAKPATGGRTARRRTRAVAMPAPEQVAELAYLLWERGEPGDATAHWLRAEAELRTAA